MRGTVQGNLGRFHGLNGKQPPRRSLLRRLYATLRKLIRRRQESDLVRRVRLEMLKALDLANGLLVNAREKAARDLNEARAIAARDVILLKDKIDDREETISNLRDQIERQKADYVELIRSRDQQIVDLADRRIPKLERELEVEKEYSAHLATLVGKKLLHEQAEIAVLNLRIAVAEEVQDSPGAGMMPRRDRSI